jgi:hypothetical protein
MRKPGVLFLILLLVPLVAAGDGAEKYEPANEESVDESPEMGKSTGNQTGNSTAEQTNSTSEDEISGEEGDARLHENDPDRPCPVFVIGGETSITIGDLDLRAPITIDPNNCQTIDNQIYKLLP